MVARRRGKCCARSAPVPRRPDVGHRRRIRWCGTGPPGACDLLARTAVRPHQLRRALSRSEIQSGSGSKNWRRVRGARGRRPRRLRPRALPRPAATACPGRAASLCLHPQL